MPELPEVETVVRQLQPLLNGRTVVALRLLDARLGRLPVRGLAGRRVARVVRLGKQVAIELAGSGRESAADRANVSSVWLGVHLRMTGRLIWYPDGAAAESVHVRARLTLDGGTLVFADVRRFGTLVIGSRADLEPAGLDPTSKAFSRERLAQLLERSVQPIKVWLLRQDRLVGLGNIYACEILHAARIHPERPARALNDEEIARLHAATCAVLAQAIENCGTTFSDFQDAHGVTGSYQRYLRVYGREDDPCHGCGKPVSRIVQQQRSTFFCAGCQSSGG